VVVMFYHGVFMIGRVAGLRQGRKRRTGRNFQSTPISG
jgi:hypothetical protein